MKQLTCHSLCYLVLYCLLHALPVAADSPRLYDVEIVVFSHLGGNADGELLQSGGNPARAAGAFPDGEFTELAGELYTLNNIRDGLAASPGYRVLFHRAWRQLAYDRAHAVDYPVHTIADQNRYSVDGTVTLVRERFLHLDIDLSLLAASGGNPVQYSDAAGNVSLYRLVEQRRIRSSELHYFDHPRFGVIARVTPVETVPEPVADGMDEQAPEEEFPDSADVPLPHQAPVSPLR